MKEIYTKNYRQNLILYWRQYYPDYTIPAGFIIHHIRPQSTFINSSDPKIHHPRNLIALHPDDHYSIHKCRGDKMLNKGFITSTIGRITSDETKKKISNALIGRPSPLKGRKTPQHVIDKLTGRKVGEKQKRLQSLRQQGSKNTFYNKRHSVKTKQLMSKQRKGRKWYNNGDKEELFVKGKEFPGFKLGRLNRHRSKIEPS